MNYINKCNLSQSTTLEEINAYTEEVRQGRISCGLPSCPNCKTQPDFFKRHDARKRKFYIVIEQIVIKIVSLLVRWKCPGCSATRTEYPSFALPYKRYTLPTIQAFCACYIENHDVTYRSIVNAFPLEYQSGSDFETNSAPMMEHSTIHRWITTLGCYSSIVNTATDLILQKEPSSSLCRNLGSLIIPPKKYHSSLRQKRLRICLYLIVLDKLFGLIFNISIFPKLATNCGYG